jgi:hypothetical protein
MLQVFHVHLTYRAFPEMIGNNSDYLVLIKVCCWKANRNCTASEIILTSHHFYQQLQVLGLLTFSARRGGRNDPSFPLVADLSFVFL